MATRNPFEKSKKKSAPKASSQKPEKSKKKNAPTPSSTILKQNKRAKKKHNSNASSVVKSNIINRLPKDILKYLFGMMHSEDGEVLLHVSRYTRSFVSNEKFQWADRRLELCLMMDATESMSPHILNAKLFLNQILKTITEHRLIKKPKEKNKNHSHSHQHNANGNDNSNDKVVAMETQDHVKNNNNSNTSSPQKAAYNDQQLDFYASWIEYRDFDIKPHSRLKNFTQNIDEISDIIQSCQAYSSGKCDWPEDVAGALWRANRNLNWTTNPHCKAVRVLTLVLDAPPHGMGCPEVDDYPNGGPEAFGPAGKADWIVMAHEFKKWNIIVNPVLCRQDDDLLNLFGATIAEITGGKCIALKNPESLGDYLVAEICQTLEVDELLRKEIKNLQETKGRKQPLSQADMVQQVMNSVSSNTNITVPVFEEVVKVNHKNAVALAECVTIAHARKRGLLRDPNPKMNATNLQMPTPMQVNTAFSLPGLVQAPTSASASEGPTPMFKVPKNKVKQGKKGKNRKGDKLGNEPLLHQSQSTMGLALSTPMSMTMSCVPTFTPAFSSPAMHVAKAGVNKSFLNPKIEEEAKVTAEMSGQEIESKTNAENNSNHEKSAEKKPKLREYEKNGCIIWELDEYQEESQNKPLPGYIIPLTPSGLIPLIEPPLAHPAPLSLNIGLLGHLPSYTSPGTSTGIGAEVNTSFPGFNFNPLNVNNSNAPNQSTSMNGVSIPRISSTEQESVSTALPPLSRPPPLPLFVPVFPSTHSPVPNSLQSVSGQQNGVNQFAGNANSNAPLIFSSSVTMNSELGMSRTRSTVGEALSGSTLLSRIGQIMNQSSAGHR